MAKNARAKTTTKQKTAAAKPHLTNGEFVQVKRSQLDELHAEILTLRDRLGTVPAAPVEPQERFTFSRQYERPKRTRPGKIAIIGKAPSSMMKAPYNDPSWEIWSINDSLYRKLIPRGDRQFELHNIEMTKQPGYDDYYPWLKTCQVPVFVNGDCPEIANQVIYPRQQVVESFPIHTLTDGRLVRKGCSYYTNSISYLIALAIYELEGVEQDSAIGLWGVDMAQHGRHLKSEYAHQRPSCELFVGVAIGRGIQVVIPEECDLLKCKSMYGFDTWSDQHKKAAVRKQELEQRINQCKQLAQQKGQEAVFLEGALEDMYYNDQWL